jgi:hypothetical protein
MLHVSVLVDHHQALKHITQNISTLEYFGAKFPGRNPLTISDERRLLRYVLYGISNLFQVIRVAFI